MHGEIVELVVAGKFRGFPDLAFGHFAIAQQDVDARGALDPCRAPIASPAPTESPWPSEPVAASTPGMRGVGWPSSSLENWRRVIRRDSGKTPASASAA